MVNSVREIDFESIADKLNDICYMETEASVPVTDNKE